MSRRALLRHGPALAVLFGLALIELWPMLRRWDSFGFHDWDVAAAQRYLTVLSLKRYGEAPWWNPYFCGGFPGFGHPEGAANFISPWLPLYLLADIRVALRLEVFGSALIALGGTYLLAGRFTRSSALRTLAAILFALAGRFSMQIALGHLWHLAYAYLPWALWFFDRSLEPGRTYRAVGAGVLLALMAYLGGIYPLPHSALVLSLYALALAASRRSWAPLGALTITALTSLGLALPKLAAVADAMRRAPRLIESTEAIGWRQLWYMLASRIQLWKTYPIEVPKYNWGEWGIYVGSVGVVILATAVLAPGRRGRALAAVALCLLLLGLGAFHPLAPWSLLHRLPVFASQHVPSRFLYPMLLCGGVAAAAALGRVLDARVARRPWLDALALGAVALYGLDVAAVASHVVAQAFWMEAPPITRAEMFEHRERPPYAYVKPDWPAPMYLSMLANVGVLRCYGLDPGFHDIGARAAGSPGYPGRAYVADGTGSAELDGWAPNHARVRVRGASPGAVVVYNMNWDPSWRTGDGNAFEHEKAVAARLPEGRDQVTFHYAPRTLRWSFPLCLLTALVAGTFVRRARQRAQGVGAAGGGASDESAGGGALDAGGGGGGGGGGDAGAADAGARGTSGGG